MCTNSFGGDSIFAYTDSLKDLKAISDKLYNNYFTTLKSQILFSTEKYMSERDLVSVLKLSDDKENPFQYEALVILSHNLRILFETQLQYGSSSTLREKTGNIDDLNHFLKQLINLMRTQFETKLIYTKDNQTLLTFSKFVDKLMFLVESYLSRVHTQYSLQLLWEKESKSETVDCFLFRLRF